MQYVTAGLERLILFLYPTFAVLINAFVFKQPVVRTQKIALLLTYTGIGIAYLGEFNIDISNPNFLWGSFLIFLCSITYSVYIVGSGRMIPTVGVTRFTAYAMLASTAGVFTHFALSGGGLHDLEQGGTPVIGYGLLLATIATVLPTFMMSTGMKKIGSNNVAIISAVGPVSNHHSGTLHPRRKNIHCTNSGYCISNYRSYPYWVEKELVERFKFKVQASQPLPTSREGAIQPRDKIQLNNFQSFSLLPFFSLTRQLFFCLLHRP